MYNLPPWLVSKKFFIALSLLIPRYKAPSGKAFDIFMKPLVRDFLKLWSGVRAIDSSSRTGRRVFTLRAILLWTVNDFRAYGLISGQQTKGYCGCSICVTKTCAVHSNALKNMLYLGNRKWLPPNHRFRRTHVSFDGHQEMRPVPSRPSRHDILHMEEERVAYLGSGGRQDGEDDLVKQHGVKRVSVLYELPYWAVSFNSRTPMFTNSLCDSSIKCIL